MKATLISFTCLLLASIPNLNAQTASAEEKQEYLIMAPPWAGLSHETFKSALNAWSATKVTFNSLPLITDYSPAMAEIDEPESGGNAFVAKMTAAQARALAADFSLPGDVPGKGLFVSPNLEFRLVPEPSGVDIEAVKATATDFAAKDVVPTPITINQVSVPVLYVVDTGVEPLVKVTANTYNWHPEYLAGNTVRFQLLQGRLSSSAVGTWPKPYAVNPPGPPSPWSGTTSAPGYGTLVDKPFNFTSANLKPCPPLSGIYSIDPQKDPFKHGTRILSTAVGGAVGFLGGVTNSSGAPVSMAVESIRIYKNPADGPNSILTTTATNVADGIFKAVTAHMARKTVDNPSPRSVLVFASRSTAGFSAPVESGALVGVVSGDRVRRVWRQRTCPC